MEICFRTLLQLPRRQALDKGGHGGLGEKWPCWDRRTR